MAGMLAHCRAPLALAAGELKLSRSWVGLLFGRLAKKSLTSRKPFAKNMPTDPRLLTASPRAFEVERGELQRGDPFSDWLKRVGRVFRRELASAGKGREIEAHAAAAMAGMPGWQTAITATRSPSRLRCSIMATR